MTTSTNRNNNEPSIEDILEFKKIQKSYLDSVMIFLKENPLAAKEIKEVLPDLQRTSEQVGIYKPIIIMGFMGDMIEFYHNQKMLQLSKKEFKLRKSHTRLLKEKHEFNKLAISKGEIPDHLFQQVQELQKSEEQEASL